MVGAFLVVKFRDYQVKIPVEVRGQMGNIYINIDIPADYTLQWLLASVVDYVIRSIQPETIEELLRRIEEAKKKQTEQQH